MRIVVALGGNALLRRGEPMDATTQRRNVELAARSLADLAAEHELVITHGNGPQVGLLALQADAFPEGGTYPLDVLGAESEGMIGYLLQQGLRNATGGREVATLLTQVVVDAADEGFAHPTKFIGPVYEQARATTLAAARGWTIRRDGEQWRRVVASPEPREIVELPTIERLAGAGVLVVCTGGGGVPVTRDQEGLLHGVEAVVDKDLAAALLATRLDADALMLLTDVPAVVSGWGTADVRPLSSATPDEVRRLGLPAGSMGPKVEAAARFAEATGRRAMIGGLAEAAQLLAGDAGTTIAPAGAPVRTEAT
jgi:carbamate kinase